MLISIISFTLMATAPAEAASENAQVLCPVAARLALKDVKTGTDGEVDLKRTTAAYDGDGGYGPRWSCDYDVNGEYDGVRFARAKFVTGEESLGNRFQLLRTDGEHIQLTVDRDRMRPGAGVEVFHNYEFASPHVTAAAFGWDVSERVAEAARSSGDYISVLFRSDLVDGDCPRSLKRALHPDEYHAFLWGLPAWRLFAGLPGKPKPNRMGEPTKTGQFVTCSYVSRSALRGGPAYRCEFAASVRRGELLALSELNRKACYYTAFDRLFPSSADVDVETKWITVEGQAAEVIAQAGGKPCKRRPGSGADTSCGVRISVR